MHEFIKTLSAGGRKMIKFISKRSEVLKELLPYGILLLFEICKTPQYKVR